MLRETPFRYEESCDPLEPEPAFEAVGRQTAGGRSGSRSYELTASVATQNPNADYQMNGQRRTVCWRPEAMPGRREYRQIRTDVSVSDEARYIDLSPYADRYPPGEQTTYESAELSLSP